MHERGIPQGTTGQEHPVRRTAIKTIETRDWTAPRSLIGQRIAIHAAATKRPVAELLKAEAFGELVDPGEDDPFGVRPARAVLDAVRSAFGEPVDLPLGAVVGTAVLAACVPMIDDQDGFCSGPQDPACIMLNARQQRARYWRRGDRMGVDVTDQLPFGWFAGGRWAWVLADVEPFDEPTPATGRQGLWEWKP